ncbi:MAG TPA: alkaline phosphatase PafA [Parafilimonas sp.]|nr:alkaline phosphatase PafA [Parafilimonas sp.]
MKKIFFASLLFLTTCCFSQTNSNVLARPKLVVGIVVDQMRWDYLYRYYDLYSESGGFKRMLTQGFSCENTMIPYTPTVTAAGHSCIFTGAVPATNGVVGNVWFDKLQNKVVYCAEDDTMTTVGASDDAGKMSPKNLIATTVGDELRMATNFASKVIGVSIKDRAAIFPAGHAANAAYWYDGENGKFITSSYYTDKLPSWMNKFNDRDLPDSFYRLNWNLSLSKNIYQQYCGDDYQPYEAQPLGADQKQFPYSLNKFINKDYERIASTPYGNSLLETLAKTVVTNENMGKGANPDFLTVSFSSPDYIGHAFGPDSWEQMDDYIKLDSLLGDFFSFLDAQIGKDNYTVFLTADHGVANSVGFSQMHKLPGDVFNEGGYLNTLKQILLVNYNTPNLVRGIFEYQISLNHQMIDSLKLNEDSVIDKILDYSQQRKEIAQVFPTKKINDASVTSKQKEMFQNGYFPQRSGDIQFVLKPGYVDGNGKGTTHGLWNPYDAHIPLLWYGWGINQGKTNRETYMTDIAATVSALLHIQMPSACIGKVIPEVIK